MQPQEQDLQEPERSTFLLSLLAKRKDAISARIASGIETEWEEDEEHYQGIDDANRAYAATSANSSKRWATNERSRVTAETVRSRVFLNITAPYVDAASARVADMLLPTDDRAWTLKPTPIPRMSASEVEQMGGQEGIEQAIEQAKAAAEAMQAEIDDCLVESNWHGECRAMIEDAARIGSGVLKGPYPIKRTSRVVRTDPETGAKLILEVVEIKPGTKRIDCWNFWPDGACGESIHNGSGTWEREYLSAKQVSDMVGMPGYDKPAIMAALKEGPTTASAASQAADGSPVRSDEQFELWIYYGTADADDIGSVGVEVDDETPIASVMAVILNDRLIKCSLNPLDSGRFPYDVIAWQARRGLPWGTGVSRRIRTVQRVLNGAVRAMMDNCGLSSGPQMVIGNGITPADGNYQITGRKLWRADADVMDVRAAFHAFVPPSVQAELMAIIEWAMRTAEDTTGMPAMLQGIRGDAPDTLGGMQLQNNNASGVLRRLAKRFDDYVSEPHVTRYYDWMMQHSDRDDIKGDFQIDVRASSALVERDAQMRFLQTLLAASVNPAYGLDPAKLATELLKGQRYDPKRVQYDPERLAQMQSKSNPVEEAKAGLIQAQARLADATAVNKGVEGMFSATNAANQIALQPSIAPMADAMLLSAGFTDANAAPIIPNAPPGAKPIDVPSNTSPNFPPNPAVGMDAGIETGIHP